MCSHTGEVSAAGAATEQVSNFEVTQSEQDAVAELEMPLLAAVVNLSQC